MPVGDVALGSSGLGFASRSGTCARPPAGRGVVGAGAFEILLFISAPRGGAAWGRREAVRYLRVKLQALPRRLSNRSTFRGLRNKFSLPMCGPIRCAIWRFEKARELIMCRCHSGLRGCVFLGRTIRESGGYAAFVHHDRLTTSIRMSVKLFQSAALGVAALAGVYA